MILFQILVRLLVQKDIFNLGKQMTEPILACSVQNKFLFVKNVVIPIYVLNVIKAIF